MAIQTIIVMARIRTPNNTTTFYSLQKQQLKRLSMFMMFYKPERPKLINSAQGAENTRQPNFSLAVCV